MSRPRIDSIPSRQGGASLRSGLCVVCCRYRAGYAGRLAAVGYTFAGEVGGAAWRGL